MKRVLVTGATGFVGNAVIASLARHGFAPVALIRHGSEAKLKSQAETVHGDVLKPETLAAAMQDTYAVIHLVGIIREVPSKGITFTAMHTQAAENVAAAAEKAGIRRFIHMSANGARENAESMYHITKYQAEQAVKSKDLDWTIFRPSLIFGPKDTFLNMLNSVMKKTPVFSYFGDGSYPMQPVYVDDVADCFVKAIENEKTVNKTFHLCGDEVFTYKQLIETICETTGRKRLLLPVPEFIVESAISLFGSFQWFPITRDQFIMLQEGNTCSECNAFSVMDIKRHPLRETVKTYLK